MFIKAIHAAAVSTAFVLAMGASSLSVQADTASDAYEQARCSEALNTGNAFLKQQFCGTPMGHGAVMQESNRTMGQALSLEQMNCASSTESNRIPCVTKGRI